MCDWTRWCGFWGMLVAATVGLPEVRGAETVEGRRAESLAFVRVSPRDSRYFELDDGRPHVPIGLNMIAPPGDGLEGMERWMDKLAKNRGNFIRVWLSSPFFDVEHARSGQYDAEKAKRIDGVLAMARKRGIRVKICLEHFRHLGEGSQKWAGKPLHLKAHGGPAASTADFFENPQCRRQYQGKIAWYAQRYGDDPTVFAWELWNEMNCITGGDWAAWTEVMLPELHRRFPKNLATQSLGSFDHPRQRDRYRALCTIESNDLLHRYLDLGATLEACRGPVDLLAADAVGELQTLGVRKPILLAESGAVEPRHSGPFKLYEKDKAGILLHDVLFAPFFCGAAGPGHIWHWDHYVDRNDLWHHFGRFAEAIRGIDPPAEKFNPRRIAHPRLRVYALQGHAVLLAWCRDSQNTWNSELAEGRAPEPVEDAVLALDLPPAWSKATTRAYDPWTNRWIDAPLQDGKLALPTFSRSLVVRVVR